MTALTKVQSDIANIDRSALAERLVTAGDLVSLTAVERVQYYMAMCDRCGLDPLSRPFDYIKTFEKTWDGSREITNEKLALYPNQIAAAQLRRIHRVSIKVVDRRSEEGLYMVTCQASTPDGRTIESMGVVPMVTKDGKPLAPSGRANAIKKAETQAYRRATIAICGLDFSGVDEDGGEVMKAEYFDPPLDAIDLSTQPQKAQPERVEIVDISFDRNAALQEISAEIERLKWSNTKAKNASASMFNGKKSSQDLTDEELSRFIDFLSNQEPEVPTPALD